MRKTILIALIITLCIFPLPISAETPLYEQDNVVYRSTWESLGEFEYWYQSDIEHQKMLYDFLDDKTNFAFSLFYHALCDGYLGIQSVVTHQGYVWGVRVSNDRSSHYGTLINSHGNYFYIEYTPETLTKITITPIRLLNPR